MKERRQPHTRTPHARRMHRICTPTQTLIAHGTCALGSQLTTARARCGRPGIYAPKPPRGRLRRHQVDLGTWVGTRDAPRGEGCTCTATPLARNAWPRMGSMTSVAPLATVPIRANCQSPCGANGALRAGGTACTLVAPAHGLGGQCVVSGRQVMLAGRFDQQRFQFYYNSQLWKFPFWKFFVPSVAAPRCFEQMRKIKAVGCDSLKEQENQQETSNKSQKHK